MQSDRYVELLNSLRRWRDRFAEDLREQIEGHTDLSHKAERLHRDEGLDESFGSWLERYCRQLAIQFSLKTLFVRVLEDQRLLPQRIRTRDSQQLFQELSRYLGATAYLRFVFRDAAYLLPDLFAEMESDIAWPADPFTQEFLDEVWRRPDVDRQGWLRYDFRGNGRGGYDGGFDSRFIGDLYQDIDAEARQRYALVQTPEFVSQFILEHTLVKRFEEQDFRTVTLIDPTCGSGHFLVDAFHILVNKYLEAGDYRDTPGDRARLARHVIEHHLFGADINPYACALARFRLMLAACDFSRPSDLEAFRDQHFNIVACDSLVPYEDPEVVKFQPELGKTAEEIATEQVQRFGRPETIASARALFAHEFDVVVGNPPYISVKDRQKREFYRGTYDAAHGKYGLAAPFIERFLKLATEDSEGGAIGLISSNAFANREYGKKLVEEVLPKNDLQTIIDLSGAYIPGHGTPTVILFAHSRAPRSEIVRVISNLKGEPGTPLDPAEGEVWTSIVRGLSAGHGYQDDYVDVFDTPREILGRHPWQFGGPKNRLYQRLSQLSPESLDTVVESVGIVMFTLTDDLYVFTPDFGRRKRMDQQYLRELVLGEDLRDWVIVAPHVALFPYDDELDPFRISDHPAEKEYLEAYRQVLESTILFGGKTKIEGGLKWFEFGRLTTSKLKTPKYLALPEIGTHNHVFPSFSKLRLFKHSVQVIKLGHDCVANDYLLLAGILNTSIAGFCLKQLCFNKGAGVDPIRDRYVYSGNRISEIPVPRDYNTRASSREIMTALTRDIMLQSDVVSSVTMKSIFDMDGEAYHAWNSCLGGYVIPLAELPLPFMSAGELEFVRDYAAEARCEVRQRMVFLQEEMDWLAYKMYGLLPRVPLAQNYLTQTEFKIARLGLGQRAFEQACKGYKGDWPESWYQDANDHLPGPAAELPELCENLQRLIRDRIDIIRTNKDIALLEDPLYKRRWIPPDTDAEFREALEWWLREMAEWELEQAGKPLHINEWVRRLMARGRVRAALEVYTGTPAYDPVSTIEAILKPEAVPVRPEHYLNTSGLRKLARGERGFKRGDFSSADAWRVRGKLNIPRERYMAYTSFQPGWYGWAGWDAEQRAEALVTLLQGASREGWAVHYQQCGLRASLRELLPELAHLSQADRQEFEGIATMCGIREGCFCTAFREADPELRPAGFGEPSFKSNHSRGKTAQMSLF